MEIQLATIENRRAGGKKNTGSDWLRDYSSRIDHFCRFRHEVFATESALLASCVRAPGRTTGRTPPYLVLLDSRGKQLSSETLAAWLGKQQDSGTQRIVVAIGPADGWSELARQQANLLLSLGPMTLAHELAAVVLAEQIYRAFTILKGLPYHLGHA